MKLYTSVAAQQFLNALSTFFKYDPITGHFTLVGCFSGNSVRGNTRDVVLHTSKFKISGINAAVVIQTGISPDDFSVRRKNGVDGDNKWENLEVFSHLIAMPNYADVPSELTPDITGYIYCYTNRKNGFKYIGKTINPESRMSSHIGSASKPSTKFSKALAEYGLNAFDYRILKVCHREAMRYWEAYYINRYDSVNEGYNSVRVSYKKVRIH